MKVSEFFNNDDIPTFLLGAFYGRYEFTKNGEYIYTYSAYRNWAKVYDNQELCDKSKISYFILEKGNRTISQNGYRFCVGK